MWTFAFDRRTPVSEALLDKARVARAERAVMVTTPASVKACMLKLLELLHLLETGSFSRNRRKRDKVARLLRMQRRASAGPRAGDRCFTIALICYDMLWAAVLGLKTTRR